MQWVDGHLRCNEWISSGACSEWNALSGSVDGWIQMDGWMDGWKGQGGWVGGWRMDGFVSEDRFTSLHKYLDYLLDVIQVS